MRHGVYFNVQEAQRAAKAANKQPAAQKQKDAPAVKDETQLLPMSKIPSSGSSISSKSDYVSVTGKLLLPLYVLFTIYYTIVVMVGVAESTSTPDHPNSRILVVAGYYM